MAEAKTTASKKPATLAAALVAFQSALPKVAKDASANTGKYSYDYATLDKLSEVIFPLLTSVGLSYVTVPDFNEIGFGLRTTLLHESGEKIEGFYPLGNPNNPAQAIGSAISYARRYALLSLTGVAPAGEDDDGASASTAQAANPVAAAPAKKVSSASEVREEMSALISGSGGLLDGSDANEVMAEITGGKPPAAWTAADLKKGKTQLEALLKERQG